MAKRKFEGNDVIEIFNLKSNGLITEWWEKRKPEQFILLFLAYYQVRLLIITTLNGLPSRNFSNTLCFNSVSFLCVPISCY